MATEATATIEETKKSGNADAGTATGGYAVNFCPHCGAATPSGNFCGYCGAPFGGIDFNPAPAAQDSDESIASAIAALSKSVAVCEQIDLLGKRIDALSGAQVGAMGERIDALNGNEQAGDSSRSEKEENPSAPEKTRDPLAGIKNFSFRDHPIISKLASAFFIAVFLKVLVFGF